MKELEGLDAEFVALKKYLSPADVKKVMEGILQKKMEHYLNSIGFDVEGLVSELIEKNMVTLEKDFLSDVKEKIKDELEERDIISEWDLIDDVSDDLRDHFLAILKKRLVFK